MLPIALDIKILKNLGFNFKIIEAAYNIIEFIIKFSKKIISKYIVNLIPFFQFLSKKMVPQTRRANKKNTVQFEFLSVFT